MLTVRLRGESYTDFFARSFTHFVRGCTYVVRVNMWFIHHGVPVRLMVSSVSTSIWLIITLATCNRWIERLWLRSSGQLAVLIWVLQISIYGVIWKLLFIKLLLYQMWVTWGIEVIDNCNVTRHNSGIFDIRQSMTNLLQWCILLGPHFAHLL